MINLRQQKPQVNSLYTISRKLIILFEEFYSKKLSIQKTMIMNGPDIEFRDDIFTSRPNMTKQTLYVHSSIPKLKLQRTTWTKKVMKQKENQLKSRNQDKSVTKGFITFLNTRSVEFMPAREDKLVMMSENNRQKSRSPKLKKQLVKQKTTKPPRHFQFAVNRNVYNQNVHGNLNASGILFEKLQSEYSHSQDTNEKSKAQRHFLKSLKLQTNLTLFKGNFSRFTKKDIVHCLRTKRFIVTSDFQGSIWQREVNPLQS